MKENFTVFHMLFTELQTDKNFVRFGPKRAPKSAFSYCFVDVVPPKPLRERRFGAWTRVFENEKRECTSSIASLRDMKEIAGEVDKIMDNQLKVKKVAKY